jgi:hypothetical protein
MGCAVHIVHNAMQTAADCLPVDIEYTVSKIYQHFHIYIARVQTLQDFCDFADVEYKNILGHTKTRWLSLVPAVKRIVVVYPALASYFLTIEKCPTMLKKISESKQSFLYLISLQNLLEMFNVCIKELEKENISPAEVKYIIDALLVKAENKTASKFRTLQEKNLLIELENGGDVTSHQFDSRVSDFYGTANLIHYRMDSSIY